MTTSVARAAWADLSLELLVEICRYLDRNSLRSVRLVNSQTHAAATLFLFREIHLRPNPDSFQRANMIASEDRLRYHVMELKYHDEVIGDSGEGFEQFDYRMNNWTVGVNSEAYSKFRPDDAFAIYKAALVRARDFEKDQPEESQLKDLLSCLPELEAVGVYAYDYLSPEPTYLETTTFGASGFQGPTEAYLKLIRALSGRTMKAITGRRMEWEIFGLLTGGPPETLQWFSKVQAVNLVLPSFSGEQLGDRKATIRSLRKFLASLEDLKALDFDFGDPPFEGRKRDFEAVSIAICAMRWPKLESLGLTGLVAAEDQIVGCLKRHSSCLKSLRLTGVIMPMHVHRIFPQIRHLRASGSILSLFSNIASGCHLKHVELDGKFSNGWNGAWVADKLNRSRKCLRFRIEQFLCRQAKSPFSDFENLPPRRSSLSISSNDGGEDDDETEDEEDGDDSEVEGGEDGEEDGGENEEENCENNLEESNGEEGNDHSNMLTNAETLGQEDWCESGGNDLRESDHEDESGSEAMDISDFSDPSWSFCSDLLA